MTTEISSEVSVWENPGVVDRLDEVISSADNLDLVMSQIPSLFGTSMKATYLGFRALGLTSGQALEILGYTERDLNTWRKETPAMLEFENQSLGELQARVGADIVRLGFLRNMGMFLLTDQQLIMKAQSQGIDSLSKREFTRHLSIRRFYGTHDLLALDKAVAPERHRDMAVTLSFGENTFEVLEAKFGEDQLRQITSGDVD